MKNTFWLLSSLVLLTLTFAGCDKGRPMVDKVEADFQSMSKEGLNAGNLQRAKEMALLYKLTSQVYANKGSGERALKNWTELKRLAAARQIEIEKAIAKLTPELDSRASAIDKRLEPTTNKIKKNVSTYENFKFKVNDCIAEDDSPEFEKETYSYDKLNIYQIKQVGRKEALLEPLFVGSQSNLLSPSLTLAATREPVSRDFLFINQVVGIDCTLAKSVAEDYRKLMESALPFEKLSAEFRELSGIVNDL